MRVVRDADEDEMILAFLRAEVGSPRWSPHLTACLGDDLNLIVQPDPTSHQDDQRRKAVLTCYRGFSSRSSLFEGFPETVDWKLLDVTVGELGGFRYGVKLVASSRPLLVRDAASDLGTIADDLAANILALEAVDRRGSRGPDQPIIAVAQGPEEIHVLLEGYSRATVYLRGRDPHESVEVIAGYATDMERWSWF
jgi:hypothetical protein